MSQPGRIFSATLLGVVFSCAASPSWPQWDNNDGRIARAAKGIFRSFSEASPQKERQDAVAVLNRPDSSSQEKMDAMGVLKEQGTFSADAAEALLGISIDPSEKNLAARRKAAWIFYLFFYDMTKNTDDVFDYLLRPDVQEQIARGLNDSDIGTGSESGTHTSVRRSFTTWAQIQCAYWDQWISSPPIPQGGPYVQKLAAAYVPLMAEALSRSQNDDLRNEYLVALEDMADHPVLLRAPGVYGFLDLALKSEQDADTQSRIKALMALLKSP